MNRITRIAALALAFTATGTAMAESIGPAPAQTPFSHAPLARVSGATHDFDYVQPAAASVRSRADVRAETQAAIADGTLRVHGEDYAPMLARAKDVRHVAQLGR